MGIVVIPTYGSDPATVTAANLDAKVAGLGTEFNGSIDNDNIKAAAAIAATKLNLAAIAQSISMTAKDITEAKCADIASASTCTIWATDGNFAHITGTTTITSFGTAQQAGDTRTIVFDGILTLTHNSTSLILPTGANITTAAGDTAIVRAETTANARVIAYLRKDGTALAATSVPVVASQTEMEAASSNTVFASPGTVNWHPGVAKAYGNFNGTGTPAFGARYNFDSSITDNGTGNYTLSITTDFSSSNYSIAGCAGSAGNTDYFVGVNASLPAQGSVRIAVWDTAGSSQDPTYVSLIAFGDQ